MSEANAVWDNHTMQSGARVLQLAASAVENADDARALREFADALDMVTGGEPIVELSAPGAPGVRLTMREEVDHLLSVLEALGLELKPDSRSSE